MKIKYLKIIIINILILILLFLLFNYFVYKFLYNCIEYNQSVKNNRPFSFKRQEISFDRIKEIYDIRKPVGLEYNSPAIIIFGCSYAYGYLLEENQTFGYKLSQRLKRPVYNLGSSGISPQFDLIRIRNHDIDNILKKTEYVIIVTIGDHALRVHTNSNGFPDEYIWPRYDKKGNKLVLHKSHFPIIEGSYLYKYIEKRFFNFLMKTEIEFVQDYIFDYVKLHYETIRNEIHKINPNIKIIILLYYDQPDRELFLNSPRWKELEDEGFIFIDLKKELPVMFNKYDYRIPGDGHPNERAWEKTTDLIINKLKIIKKEDNEDLNQNNNITH